MPLISTLLLIAVLGLLVGPLMVQLSTRLEKAGAALDGFALTTVGGLVVLHLLPEAIAHGGWTAIGFAIAGVLGPLWIDRWATLGDGSVKPLLLLIGLAPHAAIESAALGVSTHETALGLGVSIAAHRLPVGLILFSMISKQHGTTRGWAAVFVLVIATLVGFWLGDHASGELLGQPYSWLQALVGGSLLHVAFSHHLHDCTTHAHTHEDPHHHEAHHAEEAPVEQTSKWSASGAILGGAVLALSLGASSGHIHADTVPGVLEGFWHLALRTAPLLLVGYLLAGLVCGLLGPASTSWLSGPQRLLQAMKGVGFGVRMPVCSCGVLPTYETLVQRTVPGTAALGFLVATPGIGLETMLFSLPLLGTNLTLARLGAALMVAWATSLIVGHLLNRPLDPGEPSAPPSTPAHNPTQVMSGLQFGFTELFDHTFPWVLAGLLAAASMEPLLVHNLLQGLPTIAQIALFLVVSIPFYVCASGATPVAAMAIHLGISPGAALAFLVAGPATNIATFRTLGRLHSRRVAVVFGCAVTAGALLAGVAVDGMAIEVLADLHDSHQGEQSLVNLGAGSVLAVLALVSLYRQGPRGMLAKISTPIQTDTA